MKKLSNFARPIFILILFLCTIVVAAVLKVTSSVVIPLTIAILVSLVFEPVLNKLNKKFKIPWAIGIVIILIILMISISLIGTLLFNSVKAVLSSYPKYEERITFIYQNIAQVFQLPYDAEDSLFANLWNQLGVRKAVQDFALTFSSSLIGFMKDFVMVLLFAVFFMLELKYFRPKIEYAFEVAKENRNTTSVEEKEKDRIRVSNIISDIIQQVTKYISVKFFISLLTGIFAYIGCVCVGLDFPIIWAFIAFVLNFIPNFGSIISVILTTVFAVLQFWPNPTKMIITLFFMTAINFCLGNIIEPRVQGKNLGLSPFIIIASLSVWGYIWGFVGLILAVPMMVTLKIICENFSLLQPVSVIIGSFPPEDSKKETKKSFMSFFTGKKKNKNNEVKEEIIEEKCNEESK